jgi:probable F420-dependent oxidoreductase
VRDDACRGPERVRLGAVFPTREIGSDPAAIRRWAAGAAALGYDHVSAADHVLGIAPTAWRGRSAPQRSPSGRSFSHRDDFHEPFVLLAFLAAAAPALALLSSVLILPQRQTALVAKQAAELDALSGGRLRLGVGLGWNRLEYEAMGAAWEERGARLEEQIELMRRLWTEDSLSFRGRFHRLPPAGLRPKPVQDPLPLWLGGRSARSLKRIGRLGHGWILDSGTTPGDAAEGRQLIATAAREAGRDPAAIGLEPRVAAAGTSIAKVRRTVEEWLQAGATHLSIDTQGGGLGSVDDHLELLAGVAGRGDAAATGS